jgi:hypothetical protein
MAKIKKYFTRQYGIEQEPKEISQEEWVRIALDNGFAGRNGGEPLGFAGDSISGFTRMIDGPDDDIEITLKEFIAGDSM